MVATLRVGLLFGLALLASLGVGQSDQFSRLDQGNAGDWAVVLAQFPRLSDSQQITVLQGLKGFIGKGQKGHLPEGEAYDFLPSLAIQHKLLGLPEIDRSKGVGNIQQAQALGELGSNAFDYALNKGSSKVRQTVAEVAEELLPKYYVPLVSGRHCATGYDYLTGNFSGGFSDSMRAFAAKNLAWVEKADPRSEAEGAKHLLRAHLKLPSAKHAIIQGLASGNEDTINKTLARVMQWPDPEFIPYLRELIVVEDSQVRPFWSLTDAVMAYREGASAIIEPVQGKVKHRNHWMNDLADHACRESWEYCLQLTKSPEPWQRELGVSFVKAVAQGFWMPGVKPKTQVPKDAMSIAHRIVAMSLSDSDGGHQDWSGQTDRLVKFASDASSNVRKSVAHHISELPSSIREELIWKLAGDPSLDVQTTVASEIRDESDLGLEEKAKKALTSASVRERAASAVILASLGFESEVLPLLKDRDAHVRASTLMALEDSTLVGPDLLLGLCADKDSAVVRLALNALEYRIDDYRERLALLNKALVVANAQNVPQIQRRIERIQKAMEDHEDH